MGTKIGTFLICILIAVGCGKQNDWLDAKRQQSDITPTTLADFQAIMNNTIVMNTSFPTIGQTGADNYYFPNENVGLVSSFEVNSYIWAKDIFGVGISIDYQSGCYMISHANAVLEGLFSMTPESATLQQYNNIKGQALFFRAIAFYELASVFCKQYDKTSANTDLGLCVRTSSNINQIVQRSSIAETYNQIINDLKLAIQLLPVRQSHKTRPSKPAAFAMLARTYLIMGEYTDAKAYADSALVYANDLLDFNSDSVSLAKPYRFPDFLSGNKEVIFYAYGLGKSATIPSDAFNRGVVDSNLYRAYDNNDLRKTYFYKETSSGVVKFIGTYSGIDKNFTGIATNEIYFIRAECNARLNNITAALSDLNMILQKRFRQNTYVNFSTTNADTALYKILEERSKELPFTGQIRWQDLKRLNKDIRFSKTLKRVLNGETYQLGPNDKRYVYPFPQNEIDLTGIQQNER